MVKYYAVKIGKQVGIFMSWIECESMVKGFKGAKYKSFESKREAEAFIKGENISTPATYIQDNIAAEKSIFTDACHNKTTGDCSFASVVDHKGADAIGYFSELFPDMELRDVVLPVGNRRVVVVKFSGVESQQINGGELIGLICGLRIALTVGIDSVNEIFCDSRTVLSWSLKLGNEQRKTFDPKKVSYIDELIELRKMFEHNGGRIAKIDGDLNLADLGYHVKKRN